MCGKNQELWLPAGGDTEEKHEKSDSFCRRNLPGADRQPEKYSKQYERLPRRLPAGKFPVTGSNRLSGKSVQPWNFRKSGGRGGSAEKSRRGTVQAISAGAWRERSAEGRYLNPHKGMTLC